MGQTDSKSEKDFLQKIDSDYEFIKHLNDDMEMVNYMARKMRRHRQQLGQLLGKNKLQLKQSLTHPNLIQLKESMQTQEEQVYNTFYKINLLFEYVPQKLKDAVESRKQVGAYYGEQEILQMLNGAIEGLAKFQDFKIAHYNLRVQTLSYQHGKVKISNTPLLTNITSFLAMLQDYGDISQGNYLSPILIRAVLNLIIHLNIIYSNQMYTLLE